jgi:hypothetical protein
MCLSNFLLIVIVIVILIGLKWEGHGSCGLSRSFSAGLAPICPLLEAQHGFFLLLATSGGARRFWASLAQGGLT